MDFESYISNLLSSTLTGIVGGLVVHWAYHNIQFFGGELQNKKYIKYPAMLFILISTTSIIGLLSYWSDSLLTLTLLCISIALGLIFLLVLLINPKKILTHKQLS